MSLHPRKNTLAIVSLAFGIIGLVLLVLAFISTLYVGAFVGCWFWGVLPFFILAAIGTGGEANLQIRNSQGTETGGNLVLAGLILSCTNAAMFCLIPVTVFMSNMEAINNFLQNWL